MLRFLNVEYLFNRIYYFFANIFGGVGNIDFRFAGSWLTVLAVLVFIVFVVIYFYAKIRVAELDDEADAKYKGSFTPQYKHPAAVNSRWEKIETLFDSGNANDWRVAILEADAMLDELLVSLGVPGENLGERLKALTPATFPTLQNAWEAHKVRNLIAHEGMNFSLSRLEVDSVRRNFQLVFKDAGII